jgi:ABC-type branched-subunit amino acid transport system substrate-binding protein
MVEQLVSMGLQNIAFVYLDNAFGKEVLKDAQNAMAGSKLKSAADVPLAFDGSNAGAAVKQIVDAKANAVFLACTGTSVTDFVLELRKSVGALPVVGMSVSYTDIRRLGQEKAQGLATAMVFPNPKMKKFAIVREYDAAMAASNLQAATGSALESWINAQVMIEGVKRAGRDITRDKLRSALASMRGFEVGELNLTFTPAAPFVGSLPVKMGVYGADFTLRT